MTGLHPAVVQLEGANLVLVIVVAVIALAALAMAWMFRTEVLTADEDAEPGRVQKVDILHVDDQLVVAFPDQFGDLVPQLGCRVDVDLPADGDNRATVHLAGLQRKIHGHSSEPGAYPVPAHSYASGH